MDELFQLIVYGLAIYLIFIQCNILQIVGWIVLFSHLFKDVTKLTVWPIWCEFAGMGLAFALIYGGFLMRNYFVVLLGIMKLAAHCRQLCTRNNRYYY